VRALSTLNDSANSLQPASQTPAFLLEEKKPGRSRAKPHAKGGLDSPKTAARAFPGAGRLSVTWEPAWAAVSGATTAAAPAGAGRNDRDYLGSNLLHDPVLCFRVGLEVSLRGSEVCMSGQYLHVPQGS
jgi:hypothetical protein